MITVTSEPYSVPITDALDDPKMPPVPVSDCFQWCLQLDDADGVTTAGSFGTVEIEFDNTPTVPANGTEFTIWGRVFTVSDTVQFSSMSFEVDGASGLTTALNFSQMILSNIFFNRAVDVAITSVSPVTVVITWKECREQSNFGSAGMVLDIFTTMGGTAAATNGVSPVYVDGLKVVTRVGFTPDASITLADYEPVTVFEGMEPDKLCDTVGPVCVDYRDDITAGLYTVMPELGTDTFVESEVNGNTMMRPLQLEYGWTYREDCVSKSGTFKRSDLVIALNAAFDTKDPYKMRPYWYDHPDGFPPDQTIQKFLTTQPYGTRVCFNSYVWLWMCNNYQNTWGTSYKLRARYVAYKKDVGYQTAYVVDINNPGAGDGNKWFQPVNFNVSPQIVLDNVAGITEANLEFYEIQVIITDGSNVVLANGSDYIRFVPEPCGCDTTDVYFLTPAGGYSTMIVDVVRRDITPEGNEVNMYVPCDWTFDEKNSKGGRTLVNLRAFEKIEIIAKGLGNTDADRNWFKHFCISPVKFIRETVDGVDVKRKIIVDLGQIQIYESGGVATLSATCYFQDIPLQNPSNR
jgi:hypothetical protein